MIRVHLNGWREDVERTLKANHYLVDKYDSLDVLELDDSLWLSEFNCRIVRTEDSAVFLEWDNDADYTAYVLRFG
jgi:elongation factor P hydroxylase